MLQPETTTDTRTIMHEEDYYSTPRSAEMPIGSHWMKIVPWRIENTILLVLVIVIESEDEDVLPLVVISAAPLYNHRQELTTTITASS